MGYVTHHELAVPGQRVNAGQNHSTKNMDRIIVKPVPQTRSPYGREQRPVRTINPATGIAEEVGEKSGRRKPNGVHETLRFDPDREQGRFVTGLDAMVTNPFKGMEPLEIRGRYGLPNSWSDEQLMKIGEAERITKQQYFEILDGVEFNFYTSTMAKSLVNSPIPMRLDDGKDKTFVETFEIILYESANVFTSDTSRGRMAIQLVTNSSQVARGMRDVNKDVHSWYIAEEFEEEKTRGEIDDLENKAIVALFKLLNDYPSVRAYQVGVNLDIFRGQLAPTAISDQLNRYVKAKLPNSQRSEKVERLTRFMREYDTFKDNYPLFMCRYLVNQALNVGIVYIEGGKLYWREKRNIPTQYVWRSTEQLVTALMDVMPDYDESKEINDSLFGDMVEELRKRGNEVVL